MAASYNLDWFKALVLRCDPTATKYHGNGNSDFTVWQPKGPRLTVFDNRPTVTGWNVEVERCCKGDNDRIAADLLEALSASERVGLVYTEVYDEEDKVHTHLFVCEVC